MSAHNEIEYTLTLNTQLTYSEIRKLEISMMRILGYIQRLTPGNTDLHRLIDTMQSAITVLRSMQIALHAVQIARMSAGDPIAWLSAGTTVVAVGFSGYSMYESMTGY